MNRPQRLMYWGPAHLREEMPLDDETSDRPDDN